MEAFPHIWLVSDDAVLTGAIPDQLQHARGATCTVAASWEEAEHMLGSTPPPILLIDSALGEHALSTLTTLRETHPLMAILGIGTKNSAETEAKYFEALPLSGFVKRPVAMPALVRSLEHLRYQRSMNAGKQVLPLKNGITFCPASREVKHGEKTASLTDKESAILLCLYHHRHGWLPREAMLEEVWGYSDDIATHTLETHLYRLRAKLREALEEDALIATKQGAYQLQL